MSKIINAITIFLIFIVNLMTRWLPVNKKMVLLISNFSNELPYNYNVIYDALKDDENYKVVTLLEEFQNDLKGKVKYLLFCLKQAIYINMAKVVVIDSYNIVLGSISKKKETTVIQLWHASGAFKKFGHDVPRQYQLKQMDYAIVTSSNLKQIYSNALNINVDNILPLGNPRTDKLFDDEYLKKRNKDIRDEYKIGYDEIVVTYAPTLANNRYDDGTIYLDMDKLEADFSNKYKLATKYHPRLNKIEKNENILDLTSMDIVDVFSVTDVLITDYSSIIFEFLTIKNKLIFYMPDFEAYTDKVGFYIDTETFNKMGVVTKNYTELSKVLNNINSYEVDNAWVKDYYFEYQDGKSGERVIEWVKNKMKE